MSFIGAFSYLIQDWHIPTKHYLDHADYAIRVQSILEPGSVVLTRSRLHFTNLFIPGFWCHTAIASGDGMIIEAVGEGVRCVPVAQFIKDKDYVLVLTSRFCDAKTSAQAYKYACRQVGHGYDFEFNTTNHSFYCSELVFWCYRAAYGRDIPFLMRSRWGKETVTANDFAKASKYWDRVGGFYPIDRLRESS